MTALDVNFRPDTYWPESLTPVQRMSSIKGAVRRSEAERLFHELGFAGLDPSLVRESLPDDERDAWGAIHPSMMGGEYLPDLLPNEVEICRISLRSVTADQISVRARRSEDAIVYRVVSEYEELDYVPPIESSNSPLTQLELLLFIHDTYVRSDPEVGGIFTALWNAQLESSNDRDEILGFIKLSSPFYPQINRLYGELGDHWCDAHLQDAEDDSDLPDPVDVADSENWWLDYDGPRKLIRLGNGLLLWVGNMTPEQERRWFARHGGPPMLAPSATHISRLRRS
jgi:hypothetical protein